MTKPCVHFVGFRDDRYWNAVRVWGEPAFIHYVWDRRAQRDIAPDDVVVFAKGPADKEVSEFNGPDIFEPVCIVPAASSSSSSA